MFLIEFPDGRSAEAASAQIPEHGSTSTSAQVTFTTRLAFVGGNDGFVGGSGGFPAPFGVQFYTPLMGDRLDYAADAGVTWIRWPVSWSSVEPSNTVPESYDWSVVDQSVISAAEKNMRLILTIADQPSWAATYAMGPVMDTANLLEFVSALVERYDGDGLNDAPGSPKVRYYEIYNEPDNFGLYYAEHGGWGYWGHNGAGYAELLKAVYPAVKAASPQAKVVFGGLALDWFDYQGGPFDSQFLDAVLAACEGQHCFDVMNFHYFPCFRSQWEPYGPGIIGKTNYVRQRLAAHGFGEVLVFCTETNWPSGGTWGSDGLQSRYVVKGFVRSLAAGLDVVSWWFIWDNGNSSYPGLLDENVQPKPSYRAYQNMTRMLRKAHYKRALTPGETGSQQLVGYVFRRSGHRLDVVWTEDDTHFDPDDDPWLPLTVNASTIRLVDKFGNESLLSDEDDGVADGRITISVGGSPYFVEYNPCTSGVTYTLHLPSVYGHYSAQPVVSPLSIQVAALHEVDTTEEGYRVVGATAQDEWLARYEEAFPALLEALEESGAGWSRVRVDWSRIQPDPPPAGYLWGPYHDEKLRLVAETSVQWIATVADAPAWAADAPCAPIYAEQHVVIAESYGARIDHWPRSALHRGPFPAQVRSVLRSSREVCVNVS